MNDLDRVRYALSTGNPAGLTSFEADALWCRFKGLKFTELARNRGVSRQAVSQAFRRAGRKVAALDSERVRSSLAATELPMAA